MLLYITIIIIVITIIIIIIIIIVVIIIMYRYYGFFFFFFFGQKRANYKQSMNNIRGLRPRNNVLTTFNMSPCIACWAVDNTSHM